MSLETLAKVVSGVRALDITITSVKLMVYLADAPLPGATVRGASAALGIQKPYVTRSMQQLSAKGWADQRPDPLDRRSVYLGLTRKGRTQVDNLVKLLA